MIVVREINNLRLMVPNGDGTKAFTLFKPGQTITMDDVPSGIRDAINNGHLEEIKEESKPKKVKYGPPPRIVKKIPTISDITVTEPIAIFKLARQLKRSNDDVLKMAKACQVKVTFHLNKITAIEANRVIKAFKNEH